MSIAQRLGYISVVETLKVVTEKEITTTTTTTIEEKYRVLAPESMQETFMSDSEDEGGRCHCFILLSMRYIRESDKIICRLFSFAFLGLQNTINYVYHFIYTLLKSFILASAQFEVCLTVYSFARSSATS